MNSLQKLAYYRSRYGTVHAVCAYLGRKSRLFWRFFGPLVTRRYRRIWTSTAEQRILNLGGGSNTIDGCLTADIDPRADVYVDVTARLPFGDDQIDAVIAEELIEHLALQQGERLLGEIHRILKPGGVLRIATPDLDYFCSVAGTTLAACNAMNRVFYGSHHRYIYSRMALEHHVGRAGFIDLRRSSYRDQESALGYFDSHADRFGHLPEISQYLEARKHSR